MGQIYITREHLNAVGMASKDEIKGNFAVAAASLATSGGLGVLVGYRHASGVGEDEAMPSLGPVPVDALAGGAGLVAGIFMKGMLGKVVLGAGIGASNVFSMSAGQSVGAMLYEKMQSQGTGQEMAAKQIPAGQPRFRDMHGNYHPGRIAQQGSGGTAGQLTQLPAAQPKVTSEQVAAAVAPVAVAQAAAAEPKYDRWNLR